MEIDQFVLDNVFHHIPATSHSDAVWWRETTDHDGYILVWVTGEHLHTYRYPPDLFEERY